MTRRELGAALWLATGAALAGCAVQSPGTDASERDVLASASCHGCQSSECCQDGVCVDGTQPEACGRQGRTCAVCADDRVCDGNACVPRVCGPQNCPLGCCSGTYCERYLSERACGTQGVACKRCGSEEVCSPDGICRDPVAPWYLVGAASALLTSRTCSEPCDLYATVTLAGLTAETKPAYNTLLPTWNHALFVASRDTLLAHPLEVVLTDKNELFADREIARCSIAIAREHLITTRVAAPCEGVQQVFFDLVPTTP